MNTRRPGTNLLLALAVLRAVLALAAIPLAPFLYREHFLWLVALRPTKEVLLAGGFLARQQDVHLLQIPIPAVPLTLGGVWLFYELGRRWRSQITSGKLPGIVGRVLPPKRIKKLAKALKAKGGKLVFLGRLAMVPSSLVGAAAGSAGIPHRRFLLVDAAGAVLSIAESMGAGYLLGYAYKNAGPWISVAGFAILALAAILLGRALRRA